MNFQDMTQDELIAEINRLKAENDVLRVKNDYVICNQIFDSLSVGVLLLDEDLNILKANAIVGDMIKKNLDEIYHQNIGVGLSCKFADKNSDCGFNDNCLYCFPTAILRQALKENVTIPYFEIRPTLVVDGKEINPIFKLKAAPVKLGDKKCVVVSLKDITEQKQFEEALVKSEQRYKYLSEQFEAIFDHIPALVFYKDTQNNFIKVNKFLTIQHGKSKKELEGKNLSELYPIEDAMKYLTDDLEVITSREAKMNMEESWETESGNKWVLTSKIPFKNEEGEIIGVIGMSTDITDRKNTEIELDNKRKELEKINGEKDKLFSIIAHDLRDPFNSFIGLTHILLEKIDSYTIEEIKEIADNIANSSNKMYRLLENLLHWAMMQQGKLPFDSKLIKLKPVVFESTYTINELIKNKEITIEYDIAEEIEVMADSCLLEVMLRNLVSNAVKYTHNRGRIYITARDIDNEGVQISIKDTGIGMSSTMIHNLFKLTGSTNRKGTNGEASTGLGLVLCKEIIEKLNGEIYVVSEVDKGSVFNVILPKR